MADTDQLLAWREALLRARYAGTRTVECDGRKVEYRSDSEMASALADLEVSATPPPSCGKALSLRH